MDIRERDLRVQELNHKRKVTLRKRIILSCSLFLFCTIAFSTYYLFTSQKDSKALLQQYYETFLQENELALSKSDESFAEWFFDTYPKEIRKDVISALENGNLTKPELYKLTGESMFVLSDRYQGLISDDNQIYERTGKTSSELEITIAGDLCLEEDGYVIDYYDSVNDLQECISPELLTIMNEADIFYLDHEYCISDRGTPLDGKVYTFRANPDRIELLKEMGTDLVSLANNHVYDYGADALIDTCDILESSDIAYVGGGRNLEEATRPVYFIINGIKVGFVSASNAEKYLYTPQSEKDSPGILTAYDTTEFNRVIQDAAKNCDYLIAYIHWGTEDSSYFNEQQQEQGAEFVNSGADIVIGSHTHSLQGIEYVNGKPVIYSLGNFWFNSDTQYTGLLQLNVSVDGLTEMTFIPCRQTNSTVQFLNAVEEQKVVFSHLNSLSVNANINSEGIITEK